MKLNERKNMNEITIKNTYDEVETTQKLCTQLMKSPHYAKMGEAGIFAIIQKAKSIGMDPLDALNGGMYYVQGKTEMSGQSMLALIRSKGHSVSMDPKSTDTKVIMYGKRCDNGDTWRVEFSIEDAKKQGIYRNQWEKMPKVMCMWRCVSQLSRFLFSDVIKGVYVQGEIADAPAFSAPIEMADITEEPLKISEPQVFVLKMLEEQLDDVCKAKLYSWMCVEKLEDLTVDRYEKTLQAFENAVKFMEDQKKDEGNNEED